MPSLEFSQEEIQRIAGEIKKQLIPVLLQELHEKQIPPILTRTQFKELVGIGDTKCNELFNRADFPVNRELGHPRVVTKKFFEWMDETTDQHEIEMPYPYKIG